MPERYNTKVHVVSRIIIPFSFLISLVLQSQIAFADEKSHYAAASQLVDLTYDEEFTYETTKNFALLVMKDKFENENIPRDYSAALINPVMETLDACFHDIETQNKIRMARVKTYMEEFTEYELKELIKFYGTPFGQKALQKLPVVIKKNWERESEIVKQVLLSTKYEQMFDEKFKALQDQGIIPPQEFK